MEEVSYPDQKWLAEHSEELAKTNPGKYIAIFSGKVVAVGDDPKDVWEKIKTKYPKARITYIPKKGETVTIL